MNTRMKTVGVEAYYEETKEFIAVCIIFFKNYKIIKSFIIRKIFFMFQMY